MDGSQDQNESGSEGGSYDQAEKKIWDHIYDLLIKGQFDIPEDEWSQVYLTQFYDCYADFNEELGIDAVPLEFDRKKKSFQLLPKFLEQVSKKELKAFRDIVKKRYKDYLKNGHCTIEEEEEVPNLPYRISSDEYAYIMVSRLIGDPDGEEEVDDYGLIEDREQQIYIEIIDVCDMFLLPRLPFGYNEKGEPSFKATQDEIELFKSLYAERCKLEDLKNDIREAEQKKARKEKRAYSEEDLEERFRNVDAMFQARWHQENKRYAFPSQIDAYPIEVLSHYERNTGSLTEDWDRQKEKDEEYVKPGENKKITFFLTRFTPN